MTISHSVLASQKSLAECIPAISPKSFQTIFYYIFRFFTRLNLSHSVCLPGKFLSVVLKNNTMLSQKFIRDPGYNIKSIFVRNVTSGSRINFQKSSCSILAYLVKIFRDDNFGYAIHTFLRITLKNYPISRGALKNFIEGCIFKIFSRPIV